MRPHLCCCYLICILYCTFILQMSFTSSNPNSIPTITASSCSSTSYSMGNLSSGTGALTTSMSNVLPSSSTSTPQPLNAHSVSNYTQDSSLSSGSFVSRPYHQMEQEPLMWPQAVIFEENLILFHAQLHIFKF